RRACAKKSGSDPELFGLDAGGLDHWPPFLDLGLVERGEALGGLQLARGDIESEVGEASAHRWIGERLDHRVVQLRDRFLRRALGREQPEPARDVNPRNATL